MPTALALDAPLAGAAPHAEVGAGEATLLDDPVAQQAHTAWETAADARRLARSHLVLGGLYCAACAGTIEQALLREPGIVRAQVHYGTRRAVVAWDPAATKLSDIVNIIRRTGYEAAPDAAAPARALRQAEARSALWRLFVALFCMMQVMMYAAPLYVAAPGSIAPDLQRLLLWAAWVLSIPVVLFSAAPMFREAWAGLRQRRIGMDLPVALGIAVTFLVSSGATFDPGGVFGHEAYFDSLTMFVSFLLGGRYLALKMRNRVAAALEGAAARLPAAVQRVETDGSITRIPLHRLQPGDRVRVPVGEAFPADGRLLEGETAADEALLTGESRPVAKSPGDEAIAGSLNLRAPVVQRAERLGPDTRYEGIAALVRNVLAERPPLLRTADRIAGPFLWAVLLLAAAAGAAWSVIDPSRAVWVAVSVLIVTCPCALSLAAPSAYLAAAASLLRRGVLVQRLDALESLAGLDTVCFDKTGTLTAGRPRLAGVALTETARRSGLDEAAATQMAAALAAVSTHPLAVALAERVDAQARSATWLDVREDAGFGLEARWGGDVLQGDSSHVRGRYRLGAHAWAEDIAGDGAAPIERANPPVADAAAATPRTWLAGPDGLLAEFRFSEALRPAAHATVAALRDAGLDVALLSGDAPERVRAIAAQLGIERAEGGATPAAKLASLTALQRAGRRVGMVGDGLNDAPVMARADASFALGDGSALTRAKADFIVLSGSLADIAWARLQARRALAIVRQNLAWAVGYNALCVPLALAGWFPPWAAGLGMATSSLVVVLNALRLERAPARPIASSEVA